jgi:hypothetical protein
MIVKFVHLQNKTSTYYVIKWKCLFYKQKSVQLLFQILELIEV